MSIREKIVEYINQDDYKPLLKEELLARFNIDLDQKSRFYEVLDSLEREGLIIKTANERYGAINSDYLVVGKLEGHERGFGFVIPDESTREDVFIPAENMKGAMHGDRVIANIVKRSQGYRREEGAIIRILERGNKQIVGTFEKSRKFGFLIPDNQKIFYDVFIPKSSMGKAENHEKVVVEITKWPRPRRNPEGKVIEVLGPLDQKGTDILSIIREYELPEKFPAEVEKFALNIDQTIEEEEIENRVDLRDKKTFTIDGPDAKDLDDAISIELLENGNYLLGVHIADVSHYVKENNPLDREAYKRGNSVYLTDRVVPMLPPELSNGICSLNPNEDRLTLSVTMEIDQEGNVVKHKIEEAVINSKARLVYDDISDYLENKAREPKEELKDLLVELNLMEELTEILYKKREERGSIDFNFPETMILLDKEGFPTTIEKRDRRIANRMIEEFMLVTNETISEQSYWGEIPFLYRIHEEPSEEKIAIFNSFIRSLGYHLKGKEIHPKEFQLLTKEIEGKREEAVISTLLLRSLRKARYNSEPDIHFGLASNYYSHFTAPIRRYPDLVIHRILKEQLKGKLDKDRQEKLEAKLPDIAEHTSMTERRAEDAEREVEDMKKAQYMMDKIGQTYKGVISSLTNFGMFVQLDNTIEGLVHFNSMIDDYYHFDEDNYYLIGERTKNIYRLGDIVKIEVVGADMARRVIDFELIEKIEEE